MLSGLTLILPNVKLSFITFGEFKSYTNLSPQFLYSLHKDEPLVFLNMMVVIEIKQHKLNQAWSFVSVAV